MLPTLCRRLPVRVPLRPSSESVYISEILLRARYAASASCSEVIEFVSTWGASRHQVSENAPVETFDSSFPPGEAESSSDRTSTSDDDRRGSSARQSSIRLARIAKMSPDESWVTHGLDRTRSGVGKGRYIYSSEHMKKHRIVKNHTSRALRS